MSQMDDIQAALAQNPEFKEALEQEAKTLSNADMLHDNDNNPPELAANNNESADLYRSLNSDVGNMNGMEIPESITQMDMIEAQQANEISALTPTPTIEKEAEGMER